MKSQTPRRKRMKRQGRLQAANGWIQAYTGKNIIKGYQKWFAVDLVCAIRELKLLGIKLDEQYITQALKNREQGIINRQKKREEKKAEIENREDQDENFYYIAGYTSWGFPYGLTWDEARALNLEPVLLEY